jgi:dipeptidyl aminopeptidase/acylaminoacyl peptidase
MLKTTRGRLIICVFILVCLLVNGRETIPEASEIPDANLPKLIQTRDFFFSKDDKSGFRISPDGKKIAWKEVHAKRLFLAFRNIETNKKKTIQLSPDGRQSGLIWSRDSRHLFYHEDYRGNENYHIFYYDINKPNRAPRDIISVYKTKATLKQTMENDPENILVTHNHRDKSVADLYKINLKTRKQTMIAQNPGDVSRWITDNEGNLRARIRNIDEEKSILEILSLGQKNWKECLSWDGNRIRVLDLDKENSGFWLLSNRGRDKFALVHFNIETGEEQLIYENPLVDISRVVLSNTSREPLFAVSDPDYQKLHCFQPEMKEAFGVLYEKGEMSLKITSKDNQNQFFTILANTYNGSHYYLFNSRTKEKQLLGSKKITKYAESLSTMKPISFKSRDNLNIHGYLTVPKGTSGENLPMVLLVHGGPWNRDRWGYNPMVQFLANRGYAVLQINFRGSSGYGHNFLEAGAGEWAGKMHNDLIDGVRWAIDEGVANPEKIAIMGSSYGGYAALVGLAFTPERFACGVDVFGPSNLVTLLESSPKYWKFGMSMMYRHIGNPNNPEDRRTMEAKSPLFHVDKITKPLLIVQGGKDVRVTVKESEQIVAAVRKAGKDVKYIFFDNEGHGIRSWSNMLHYLSKLESFLAKHLGGRKSFFKY